MQTHCFNGFLFYLDPIHLSKNDILETSQYELFAPSSNCQMLELITSSTWLQSVIMQKQKDCIFAAWGRWLDLNQCHHDRHSSNQGCGVGGKISDSDSRPDISKFPTPIFQNFRLPTP